MDIIKQLKGKRTYIIAAGLVLWTVLGLALGRSDLQQTITVLLEAGALIGIRAATTKD